VNSDVRNESGYAFLDECVGRTCRATMHTCFVDEQHSAARISFHESRLSVL
jgi:hypothetical protein